MGSRRTHRTFTPAWLAALLLAAAVAVAPAFAQSTRGSARTASSCR